jgi:acyl-[acyl-carrier-protein]-phospholipid O-acyltransferase / long-chain-fatty-acid--[acyl-carrier-protein] ligase
MKPSLPVPAWQFILRHALRLVLGWLFRIPPVPAVPAFEAPRLLLIANHQSFLDGLLLGLFLPLQPVFVVHATVMKNPFFRAILALVDYVVIEAANPMGMKRIVRLVESGRPVMIFPEGRISETGSLMKIYEGPAFVAARTGATLLPIAIEGADHSFFGRTRAPHPKKWFPRIRLALGAPSTLVVSSEGRARERRRKAGEALRQLMQTRLFESRTQQSLFEAFLSAMSLHGRRRVLVEDIRQTPYSYGDVLKMALVLGRLSARQSQPGERVGLLLPNLAPTLGLILGLNAFGRTPAMLNYTAGSEALAAACKAGCIRWIISSRAFVEQARLGEKVAALEASTGVRVAFLEDLRAQVGLKDKLWLMGWAFWQPRRVMHLTHPENEAVLLFTSGSEGLPKGVLLSHRALLANVAQIRSVVDFSPQDHVFNALPLFHSFGLTAGSLLPALSGARLFLYPSPLHYRVIPELVYDRGCTVLLGTSTFLGHYARFAHPYDFHTVRYVIAGAEKLLPTVREQWFEKFGLRILEGYGATETAPVLSVNTPMACRFGSVGQLLPGVEAKLMPVAGIDRGGQLHVRGPNLMSGYLRPEQPGVLSWPPSEAGPGWYDTGDVVDIDPDGFVHIVGRVKRFAKIAGEMISLETVEKLAMNASPNAQHAVCAKPDSARGEALVLFSTDPDLRRERLVEAAHAGGFSELCIPRQIVHLQSIPVLGTGKTDYVTLEKQARTS